MVTILTSEHDISKYTPDEVVRLNLPVAGDALEFIIDSLTEDRIDNYESELENQLTEYEEEIEKLKETVAEILELKKFIAEIGALCDGKAD